MQVRDLSSRHLIYMTKISEREVCSKMVLFINVLPDFHLCLHMDTIYCAAIDNMSKCLWPSVYPVTRTDAITCLMLELIMLLKLSEVSGICFFLAD